MVFRRASNLTSEALKGWRFVIIERRFITSDVVVFVAFLLGVCNANIWEDFLCQLFVLPDTSLSLRYA